MNNIKNQNFYRFKLNNSSVNLLIYVFFIILIIIGINSYRDFGISLDEPVNRANGQISANYIISILNNNFSFDNSYTSLNQNILHNYHDRDYGVAFDLPVYIIERLFNINSYNSQYTFRHLLTYLFFLFGVFTFYLLIKNLYNPYYGFIAILIYVLNPRIFSESFYNIKDIIFMSIFAINLYTLNNFFQKPNFLNTLLHSFITAISIDIRIIAVMIPVITSFLFLINIYLKINSNQKRNLLYISLYLFLTTIFIIIFWPWLWESPLQNFLTAFKNMSKFRWDGWILFNNHLYPAGQLPWYYLITWITITLPISHLFFFIIGVIVILKNNLFYFNEIKASSLFILNNTFLILFISPIFAVVLLKSIVYDGWRQFYFLYPLIVAISIYGFNQFYINFNKLFIIKYLICTISLIYLIYLVGWTYNFHPYSHVYFNYFAGKNWSKKYESDYWGLTNVEGLRKILEFDSKKIINVMPLGHTALLESISFINDLNKDRLHIVESIDQADYVLYNYRDVHPSVSTKFKHLLDTHNIFFEIKVDNNSILTIFKTKF